MAQVAEGRSRWRTSQPSCSLGDNTIDKSVERAFEAVTTEAFFQAAHVDP